MAVYESVILDTAGTPLELNTGTLALERVVWNPAKKKPRWVEGDDGAVLVDEELGYENATLELSVRVEPQASMDAALAEFGALMDKLQAMERERPGGLACSWTPSTGTTTYGFYALMAETGAVPVDWEQGWLAFAPLIPVTIACRPFLYGAEVTGPDATASTPLVTLEVTDVPGDVRAEGRLVGTDMASQSRRTFEWGLENHSYNSGAALTLDSDSLVTSGFSGVGGTRTGAYDPGSSGNSVVRSQLTTQPTAVCGTGSLSHVGTFRVKARVYSLTSNVRIRFAWQTGDGVFRAPASWVEAPVAAAFCEVDLGLVSIDPVAAGAQQWSGRVEAYGIDGDTLDVDYLLFIPAGEGYGKARAAYSYTAGSLSGWDDFTTLTAGTALNSRTATAGGSWATSGSATDLAGAATTGASVTRSTTSDTGSRYAILGSTNFADVEASVDVFNWFAAGTASPLESRLIVRWTDANNYVALVAASTGSGPTTISLVKVVAGSATTLATVTSQLTTSTTEFRLVAYASGLVIGSVNGYSQEALTATDSALATGGTLATGKPGYADRNASTSALTRRYDNFSVGVPVAEPIVIHSGRTIEVRSDRAIRANSAGTAYGDPVYRGSRFYLPTGTNRIAALSRRNDTDVAADGGVTDSTKIQAYYTPRYLQPR